MQADAVFVGAATWDTVVELPCLPEPDGRVVADTITATGGGPAATAAVAFARLGLCPRLITSVGTDREADAIREGLAREQLCVDDVHPVDGAATGTCVVLIDRSRHSRAICVRPGPPVPIPDASAVLDAAWVHTDHAGWPSVQRLLTTVPTGARRPLVSYDAGNLRPVPCPPGVDLYATTLAVLRTLHGELPVVELLTRARVTGADRVVATDGPNGVYACDDAGSYHVPAHRDIEVRSTLGAGDVFHGALLTALVREARLDVAVAFANAAAALSCRGLDGRSTIPDAEEASRRAARRPAAPLIGTGA